MRYLHLTEYRWIHKATLAPWVLSKRPKCLISRWTHSWRMNQLFYNILNAVVLIFLRYLFADVFSMHNGNMKHARATEFDYTNLLCYKTDFPTRARCGGWRLCRCCYCCCWLCWGSCRSCLNTCHVLSCDVLPRDIFSREDLSCHVFTRDVFPWV